MTAVNIRYHQYDIRIDRQTKWGNPFVMKFESDREFVVLKYELWLNTRPDLLLDIPTLKDKRLGCWCAPKFCHGDVLTRLSESKWIRNWFSNMVVFGTPLVEDGITYKTPENYYQAMKVEPHLRTTIADMNPFMAKKSIRDKAKFPWREDWTKELSLEVMGRAISHKFSIPYWRNLLDMTEDWEITEWNNWGDKFWGVDIRTKVGENNLGKLIMEQRNVKT